MVGFSCFLPSLWDHKLKKIVDQAGGKMQLNSVSTYQYQEHSVFPVSLKASECIIVNADADQIRSENFQKPEHMSGSSCLDNDQGSLLKLNLRKSQSLGNMLEEERSSSPGDITEDEVLDSGFPLEYNQQDQSPNRSGEFDDTDTTEVQNNFEVEIYNQQNEHSTDNSSASQFHHGAFFSVDTSRQFDREQSGGVIEQKTGHQFLSNNSHFLAKSHSLYNLSLNGEGFVADPPCSEDVTHRSMSCQNLFSVNDDNTKLFDEDGTNSRILLNRQNDVFSLELSCQKIDGKHLRLNSEIDARSSDRNVSPPYSNSPNSFTLPNDDVSPAGIDNQDRDKSSYEEPQCDNQSDGCYHHRKSYEANDRTESQIYTPDAEKKLQGSSSTENWNELTFKEISIRRVQDWINQISIDNDFILEETFESSNSISNKDSHNVAPPTSTKNYARSNFGTEVAFKYVSILSPSSSTAQMANLGLVVIPVLSAFASLRMLNLSGNGIVRINAGTFPKGLQFLNLSRNNLSAIEGLKELTRLRILDLSYNRISKLGHGLSSCRSIRELYIAGNKISEVEGLHRLLKLHILDLHDNKISTSKGLSQLAANYSSLQAVNLEGNPAQKNVGDEQLKKYLLSILPHLVYYNKKAIRTSGLKEISDRPTRSVPLPKFDLGLKSELKHIRRGISSQRKSSSSHHARSSNVSSSSTKAMKGKHVHLPSPARSKATDYFPDASRKTLSLQPSISMRRVRSEGAF